MKVKTAAVLSLALLGTASAEVYIRANAAGYFPNANKRIVIMSDADIAGKPWKITNKQGQEFLSGSVGASVGGKSIHSPKPYNYTIDFSSVTTTGDYEFQLSETETMVTISNAPYSDVIASHLRFLRAQRSGSKNTLDHAPSHLGDSITYLYHREGDKSNDPWVEDKSGKTANMQGGWYAGGNYGKFTSSIAYTTYYLLKAYQANPTLFKNDAQNPLLKEILDEAELGLSYLMKVMPDDKEFIIQVGGFDSENGIRLPEEDVFEGKRAAYSRFSASDMGMTAAALALGAQIFEQEGKGDQAKNYGAMAEKIYLKGSDASVKPVWLEKDYDLFKDETRGDNLLIGAAELYDLTKDAKYLSDAKKYSNEIKQAYWAGWNTQHMMAHSLIAKEHEGAKNYFMADISAFAEISSDKANFWGYPMEYGFSTLYGSIEIGVAAARYAQITTKEKFNPMLLSILDYQFGVNNWGVSFTNVPRLKNSVTQFNIPIYKLQTHLPPIGALALGPCDAEGHDGESKWILDDIRANYCYPFNTDKVKFFDHSDDYMTTDSWIFGVADNIYLLTLATTLFGK